MSAHAERGHTGQYVDVSVLALVVRVGGAVGGDVHVHRARLHLLQQQAQSHHQSENSLSIYRLKLNFTERKSKLEPLVNTEASYLTKTFIIIFWINRKTAKEGYVAIKCLSYLNLEICV